MLIHIPLKWENQNNVITNRVFWGTVSLYIFNFLFWNSCRFTEKLQKQYKQFPYTLYLDHSNVNTLLHLLSWSLSLYVSVWTGENKLQIWYPFTPKYIKCVFFERKKHSPIETLSNQKINTDKMLSNPVLFLLTG